VTLNQRAWNAALIAKIYCNICEGECECARVPTVVDALAILRYIVGLLDRTVNDDTPHILIIVWGVRANQNGG
jgi:hypothetical protein